MTKKNTWVSKGFSYKLPRLYNVKFESGHIEQVKAKSARDARLKCYELEPLYGYMTNANEQK